MERVTWSLLCFLICIQMWRVRGEGFLSVRFLRYENPAGSGSNGHCCDGKWGVCQRNGCDHMFTFCLHDDITAGNEMATQADCWLFRESTDEIENRNNIDFSSNIAGLHNPVDLALTTLPDELQLKVSVYDKDGFSDNEFVDFIRLDIPQDQMELTKSLSGHNFTASSRTHLYLNIRSWCGEHYYGPRCDTECVPSAPDSHMHFVCDPITGEMSCQEGWTGSFCDEPDYGPCPLQCEHGGECQLRGDTDAYCVCVDGYTGEVCEIPVCMEYCYPGRCVVLSDVTQSYMCLCPDGYEVSIETEGDRFGLEVCEEILETSTSTTEPPTSTPQLVITTPATTVLVTSQPTTTTEPTSTTQPTTTTEPTSTTQPTTTTEQISTTQPTTTAEQISTTQHTMTTEQTSTSATSTFECTTTPEVELPSTDNPVYWVERRLYTLASGFALYGDVTVTANADCDTLASNGYRYQDGVYQLHPAQAQPFHAYCDMSARGWTVIQRRMNGAVDFNRDWEEYKWGFGELGSVTNFWLGLENIYYLTNQRRYKLLMTLRVGDGSFLYAEYSHFYLSSEADGYRLHVSGFTGSAGDAMDSCMFDCGGRQNGHPFSTYDHDQDSWQDGNCAQRFQSGWWFNGCSISNLNGPYVDATNGWPECPRGRCIYWLTIPDYRYYSLIMAEMKIQPDLEYDPYYPEDYLDPVQQQQQN